MSKKYGVRIHEMIGYYVEVMAESEKEAEEKAKEMTSEDTVMWKDIRDATASEVDE